MTWLLFADSSNAVTIEPSRAVEEDIRKLRSEYRASSGKSYQYNWGTYRTWRMPVEFVNSADIAQVNSWWYSDTKLLLKQASDSQVFSVQITGVNEPVAGFIAPRRDLFKGAISLETY